MRINLQTIVGLAQILDDHTNVSRSLMNIGYWTRVKDTMMNEYFLKVYQPQYYLVFELTIPVM